MLEFAEAAVAASTEVWEEAGRRLPTTAAEASADGSGSERRQKSGLFEGRLGAMSPEPWERLSSEIDHDHRVFKLRRDVAVSPRTGAEHEFIVLESRDWVAVVALTVDDRLVLVHQYRHGVREVTIELPGGLVEDGTTFEESARAELRQETGYAGGQWTYLGELAVVPAVFTNRLHVFLARGVVLAGEPQLDEGEDIHTDLASLSEVEAMVVDGRIVHAQVAAALYLYERWRWSAAFAGDA